MITPHLSLRLESVFPLKRVLLTLAGAMAGNEIDQSSKSSRGSRWSSGFGDSSVAVTILIINHVHEMECVSYSITQRDVNLSADSLGAGLASAYCLCSEK